MGEQSVKANRKCFRRLSLIWLVALTTGALALQVACARQEPPGPGTAATTASTTAPQPEETMATEATEEVPTTLAATTEPAKETALQVQEFSVTTEDGVDISGRAFGISKSVVILSHMYPTDQTSWDEFAKLLAAQGYQAITFDFRGYGKSSGKKEIDKIYLDLEAVVRMAREDGAEKLVLIGASMGGTASLKVAPKAQADGVIAISAPTAFRGLDCGKLEEIKCPKLFMAGEGDGPAMRSAKYFFENSQEPKELVTYPTPDHGTNLLYGKYGQDAIDKIMQFLQPILKARQ